MTAYHRMSVLKAKVLVLLGAGLALSLTQSPRKRQWILKQVPKELAKINRQTLNRAIRSLYESRLVKEHHGRDGLSTFVLSENGRRYALKFNLYHMRIKRTKTWDKKWRIVMFDIPERLKTVRESLRMHLRHLGTMELQKSVFISPFPCEKEIEFIVEFYNARHYVRFIVAETIDNQEHLLHKFNLC